MFTQADYQIPFTISSHASMLASGFIPFENQVEEDARRAAWVARGGAGFRAEVAWV